MSKNKMYAYTCDLCGKEQIFDRELNELEEHSILRNIQVPARIEGGFIMCIVQLCEECAKEYAEHVWDKYYICDDFGFRMERKNNDKP